jgi:glycosyltransferase involved in cell wall biosynthesis
MPRPNISVVVPVYKEESNITPFVSRIEKVFQNTNLSYEIIFALDPSPDNTEQKILDEIQRNENIRLLVFSRRFGQPSATMAGILSCSGDYCVVIDVDLQDPPELIVPMFSKLQQGYEVIYAKRISRRGESFFKKLISYVGYALINRFSDVNIPRNTGDYRIMSRRVIEELRSLSETHGFLRGLVAYVGFKQGFVEYDRDPRFSGKGNYNRLTGSFKIGLNGLIGFSSKPLFLMSIVGFFLSGVSFLLGAWYVLQKLIGFDLTPGLSTTILVISFFSGVQLLGLGLIGEYVGRIYDEVKGRPMYIVDKRINF